MTATETAATLLLLLQLDGILFSGAHSIVLPLKHTVPTTSPNTAHCALWCTALLQVRTQHTAAARAMCRSRLLGLCATSPTLCCNQTAASPTDR